MSCSIELSLTNLVLLGALFFVFKKLKGFYQRWRVEKMLEKWDKVPRDKVIMHTVWRGKSVPCVSPFGLKLETYLRMAKIPYELETTDPMGPKGKLPWITYNGLHIGDSHLIIQFLNRKFGVNLNKNVSAEQQGIARAIRIMLEDHFFWGVVQYRWVENALAIPDLLKMPMMFKVFLPLRSAQMKKRMADNGIGKHTPTEIYQMTEDDLRTTSAILGNKKFIGGEEPCEDDCAIFGGLAQVVWAMPDSSFERLVHGELYNLKEYCERMKTKVWPDWDACLDRS